MNALTLRIIREWRMETRAMHALHKAVVAKWNKCPRSFHSTTVAYERMHANHYARRWLN